jgi:signal transduction histidine kinase
MRERALMVDGQLSVRPRPEGGTEVRLVVPVAAS